jgi:hypothetical protein
VYRFVRNPGAMPCRGAGGAIVVDMIRVSSGRALGRATLQ